MCSNNSLFKTLILLCVIVFDRDFQEKSIPLLFMQKALTSFKIAGKGFIIEHDITNWNWNFP
jgi:hypothetical protein